MRISHPYAWVLLLIGAVLGLLFMAFVKAHRAWRSARWSHERERRKAWSRAIARVQTSRRITEAGDFRLVLVVRPEHDTPQYRSAPTALRLTGVARIPDKAQEWLDKGDLPVRLAPDSPEQLAIDLAAMIGEDEADALEREIYTERGMMKWSLVADPA